MAIGVGHGAFIVVITIGAVLGAGTAQVLLYRFIPFPSVLSWEYWNLHLALEGAIAGALIAHLGWVLSDVRMRLRRSAAIAVATNVVVWVLFLIVTPPLTASEFDSIQAERNRRDGDRGIDLITHEPVIIAGRMLSTYGADGVSERLLQIFASPAIEWVGFVTVPWRYGPARATRGESSLVAAGGFVLSTAFWAAFAPLVSSLGRIWRRHQCRLLIAQEADGSMQSSLRPQVCCHGLAGCRQRRCASDRRL